MQVAEHIAALRAEGPLLASAAEQGGPDAVVPACPGWRMRDLVRHVGSVHRWATGYVAAQQTSPAGSPGEAEMLRAGPPDDKDLPGWFLDGLQRLIDALERADPAMTCWTFLAAASPLAFWARRQAHETAIHRADARLAAGIGLTPFPPGLARDGIDELIMGFGGRASKRGLRADPPCWLAVHAAPGPAATAPGQRDAGSVGPGDWLVRMAPDSASVARGTVPDAEAATVPERGGCALTGPAESLYLLLWNRGGTEGVDLRGDPRGLRLWRERMHVRWA